MRWLLKFLLKFFLLFIGRSTCICLMVMYFIFNCTNLKAFVLTFNSFLFSSQAKAKTQKDEGQGQVDGLSHRRLEQLL